MEQLVGRALAGSAVEQEAGETAGFVAVVPGAVEGVRLGAAGDGLSASFWSFDAAMAGLICGNNLAIFSDGRGSGTGILRPRSTGSRLLGTRITKCMLCLSRPDTLPASGPAPK